MATGTGNLPYPGKSYTPFDILTAEELNEDVANIESLADGTGIGDGAVTSTKIDFATLGKAKYFNNTVNLNQTMSTVRELDISDLPDGQYSVSCVWRASSDNGTANTVHYSLTDQNDTVLGGAGYSTPITWGTTLPLLSIFDKTSAITSIRLRGNKQDSSQKANMWTTIVVSRIG